MTRVVVVTGLSGSGKTLALRCLEDMGFFAVDNLPVALTEAFIDLLARGEGVEPGGAFVTDIRERRHLEQLPSLLARLRERHDLQLAVVFFEAADETLVRRFSETRRPHPLSQEEQVPVGEAIRRERSLLAGLRLVADRVIATDEMSPHELRRVVQDAWSGVAQRQTVTCHVVSFGFKFGAPRDADMVLDARFLPNPFFQSDLRRFDGRHAEVQQFLEQQPDYQEYLRLTQQLLGFVMPRFVAEGKSSFTLAVGCTGGRHRSVALAERFGRFLSQSGHPASVVHRDIDRDVDPGRL